MTKPTFFQTGPETVVPVRQVYTGAQPRYPERDDSFRTQAPADNKTVNPTNAGQALRSVRADDSGRLTVNRLDALRQLQSATNDTGNPVNQLNTRQQNSTMESMGVGRGTPGAEIINASPTLSQKTRRVIHKVDGTVDIGNSKRLIRNGDVNSVNGVVNIINELADGNALKVNDFTSRMSIVRGVIDDLHQYGILDDIDYVLRTMDDVKSKKRLLAKMVPMFFISADIENLTIAIKSLGAGRVMSIYPQGINAFCGGFRFKWTTKTTEYNSIRNQIVELFNRLDSEWNVYNRNGTTINNYESLTYMSDNFYRLFSNFSHVGLNHDIFPGSGQTREVQVRRFSTMVLTARNYPIVDVERSLANQFPKASFTYRRTL